MQRFDEVREKPHSIEVSRNTKGDYTWKIKYYFEKIEESSEIINNIKITNETLKREFRKE